MNAGIVSKEEWMTKTSSNLDLVEKLEDYITAYMVCPCAVFEGRSIQAQTKIAKDIDEVKEYFICQQLKIVLYSVENVVVLPEKVIKIRYAIANPKRD